MASLSSGNNETTASGQVAPDPNTVDAQSSSTVVAAGSNAPFNHPVFTTPASIRAWQAQLQCLPEKQKRTFIRFGPDAMDDFSQFIARTSKEHKDKTWLLKINKLVRPFLRAAWWPRSVKSAAPQASASPSSIVIGGIACTLTRSKNLGKDKDLLLDWLLRMTTNVSILMTYDICLYQLDDHVQDVLVDIYGDVLEFCHKAWDFSFDRDIETGGSEMSGKSLVKTINEAFGRIIKNFEKHLKRYQALARSCDTAKLEKLYPDMLSKLQTHQQQLDLENTQSLDHQRNGNKDQTISVFSTETPDFSKTLIGSVIDVGPDAKTEAEQNCTKVESERPLETAIKKGLAAELDALIETGYDVNEPKGNLLLRPLALATAVQSNAWAVERLLRAGADVNATDANGATPLMHATLAGDEKTVQVLLAWGCNPDVQTKRGATALHLAAETGTPKIVELLLKSGAKILPEWKGVCPAQYACKNDDQETLRVFLKSGTLLDARPNSAGHLLLTCASYNSLRAIKVLADEGKLSLTSRNDKEETVLEWAAAKSDEEFINFIVRKEPKLLEDNDSKNWSALHIAVSQGKANICELLSKQGANMNATVGMFQTSLLFAIKESHIDCAKVLLAGGADATRTDFSRSNALHYAAKSGLTELVKPILDSGADPEAGNESEETALHVAAENGHCDFMNRLLEEVPNLNLDAQDNQRQTALHLAAYRNQIEAARFLVKHHAKSLKNINKTPPLHVAIGEGSEELFELLLPTSNVNELGYEGKTALFFCAVYGRKNMAALLLSAGAEMNFADGEGKTPLAIAVIANHYDIVELLIEKGADLDAADHGGASALHFAVKFGFKQSVRKLLESGCNAGAKNKIGFTTFHFAAALSDAEMIDILSAKTPNLMYDQDNRGNSCLHLSAAKNNQETFDKLIAMGMDPTILDLDRRSCLEMAASFGSHEIVKKLLDLKVPVSVRNEPTFASVLTSAARNGYYMVVDQLLASGFNVNEELDHGKFTALTLAAATNSVKTVEKLIAAGADPYHRDVFGNNALDYASRHQPTFEAMGDARIGYAPLADAARKALLANNAHKVLQTLLSLHSDSTRIDFVTRMEYLRILAKCLAYLGSDACHEAAEYIFLELAFSPGAADESLEFTCNICHAGFNKGWTFSCVTCFEINLCGSCHYRFTSGWKWEKYLREGLGVLEELEAKSLRVKHILLPILDQDCFSIVRVLKIFPVVETLLDALTEGYQKWESKSNKYDAYSTRQRPGEAFITKIQEARDLVKESEEDDMNSESRSEADDVNSESQSDADDDDDDAEAENQSDAESGSTRELRNDSTCIENDLKKFKKQNIYQDALYFNCEGHDFLKIADDEYEKAKLNERVMGSNGRVRDEWLRGYVYSILLDEKFKSIQCPEAPVEQTEEDDTASVPNDAATLVAEQNRGSGEAIPHISATTEAAEIQATSTSDGDSQPAKRRRCDQGPMIDIVSLRFKPTDPGPESSEIKDDSEVEGQLVGYRWSSTEALKLSFEIAFELAELAEPGFSDKFLEERFRKGDADEYSLQVHGVYAVVK